jgi:hypothetical protein
MGWSAICIFLEGNIDGLEPSLDLTLVVEGIFEPDLRILGQEEKSTDSVKEENRARSLQEKAFQSS